MTADLHNLYQSVVLDHNKNPRNFGKPGDFSLTAEGFNPLCGDHYHVFVKKSSSDDSLETICFEGQGCAISKASASLMTQIMKGKNLTEFNDIFISFQKMVTGKGCDERSKELLGKLRVFEEVWKYPSRVKCAALPWHTLKAALSGTLSTTTEA